MFTSEQITLGFKRANAWFTPVQVDKYMMVLEENILKSKEEQLDLSISEPFIECDELTNINCVGNIETYLHFLNDTLNVLQWLFFLSMGDDSLVVESGNITTRTIKLSDNLDGKFSTIALNKVVSAIEFPSIKVSGFKIHGNINDILRISFNTIANDRKLDTVTNPISHLRTLETLQQQEADNLIPITLRYGTFLINDYSDALATEYGISEIDFSYDKNLEGDYVANGNTNLNETIEPQVAGESNITFALTMDYYNTKKFLEDFDLQTFKHASLEFIGPTIYQGGNPTAYRFTFLINMYKMKIINESDIINNIGLQPLTIMFRLIDDDVDNPFDIIITSIDPETFN